jgi:hypothetical protein
LLDSSKITPSIIKPGSYSFITRLNMAGTNNDSYNRYTFYRLLSQLGTDSAPEPAGKLNLNYCNVDNNGNVVPGMATNFYAWTPLQFFTTAAIRLLANAGYTAGVGTTNLLYVNYVNGAWVTNLQIQIWPTNFYTPSVHRLLQLAANIYDASTNRTFNIPTATNGFPSVFRPVFTTLNNANQVFIGGYQEVTNAGVLSLSPIELSNPNNRRSLTHNANQIVWGVPLVIGAKKGFPNFNEFAMRTAVQVTRKLEFVRPLGSQNLPIAQTNQMYLLTISNVFGIEAWNSYSTSYPRNLNMRVLGANMTAYLTDGQGSPSYTVLNAGVTFSTNYTPATWPGFIAQNQASSAGSVQYPLWTNFLMLTNCQYMQKTLPPYFVPVSGQGYTFERPSGFRTPDWWLTFTNRLLFALVDTSVNPNRIVDYVNLEAYGVPQHIPDLLTNGGGCSGGYSFSPTPGAEWCTNLVPSVTSQPIPTYGVLNQIGMGLGAQPGNNWAGTNQSACDFFRAQFPGYGALYPHPAGTTFAMTNTFYAPYVPSRTVYFYTSWQANDPLVHYTIPDLTDPSLPTSSVDQIVTSDPMQTFGTRVFLNKRYRPWGGNPGNGGSDSNAFNLTLKDPVALVALHADAVGHSDDWDFPTNKFPNVGWLGRVHRGTPWQTVYLKSSPTDLGTWMNWTGDAGIVTNVGQFSTNMILPRSAVYYPVPPTTTSTFSNGVAVYDAVFSHPTNDWHILDLFTTALNDNATRGQLSINQTNLAAWSAVLSGVVVLTNTPMLNAAGSPILDSNGRPMATPLTIQPAGFYNPYITNNPATWPPVAQIVNAINLTRASAYVVGNNAFPVFRNYSFQTLGDILAVPQLTVASPFLNTNIPPSIAGFANPNYMLNDAAYERIPQQILGLLKCDHTPRFVVYSFGQALKPADHSLVTSSSFFGLCTNYQIMAEAATRAVIRIDGAPANPHAVIESFNVLPPD